MLCKGVAAATIEAHSAKTMNITSTRVQLDLPGNDVRDANELKYATAPAPLAKYDASFLFMTAGTRVEKLVFVWSRGPLWGKPGVLLFV
jgi:hypothetical protein